MAKNEIEGFQFLLTSDRDVDGLNCSLEALTDGKGNTLNGNVNVVRYLWVDKSEGTHDIFTWYPAAMLPIDDEYQGGVFDVAKNTCRTLYVSFRTDENTVPGTYSGTLKVGKNGEEILSGDVTVRVRNVYYDEKTECLTMLGLGYDKKNGDPTYPAGPDSAPALAAQHGVGFENPDLMLEYAEFLLDNRFCATWLPFEDELLDKDFDKLKSYMDNPRMNGANIGGYAYRMTDNERKTNLDSQYRIASENGWLDKLYFASYDEPSREEHLQYIFQNARYINYYFPTSQFLDAINTDIPQGGRNIVERLSDVTTTYCPIIDIFKGEIRESLLRLKKERGDKLYWYVVGSKDGSTLNVLPCSPGTDKRLIFWQQYQQDVDGFLYWSVTTWNFSHDIWAEDYMETDFPFPKSDGMATDCGALIYWHPLTKKPVTTLGFEAMRDGVEDFQLFRMAEREFGREKLLGYIEKITTDVDKFVKYKDGSTELLADLRNQIFDLMDPQ
jgi:hypothetical protein